MYSRKAEMTCLLLAPTRVCEMIRSFTSFVHAKFRWIRWGPENVGEWLCVTFKTVKDHDPVSLWQIPIIAKEHSFFLVEVVGSWNVIAGVASSCRVYYLPFMYIVSSSLSLLHEEWKKDLYTYFIRLWARTQGILGKTLAQTKPWAFIQQPNKPGLVAQKSAWICGHERTYNVIWYLFNRDAFDEIENHANASDEWNLLESILKLRGAGFLNDALQRLDCLKFTDCKSLAEYISQFRGIVNEPRSVSSKFKLDDNFLIYRFQSNLGLEHFSYYKRYAQEHDPFTEEGDTKYTLSSAM